MFAPSINVDLEKLQKESEAPPPRRKAAARGGQAAARRNAEKESQSTEK